jgi:hypothetical protein
MSRTLPIALALVALALLADTADARAGRCPRQLRCHDGAPTRLWYRVEMNLHATAARSYTLQSPMGDGPDDILERSRAQWTMESRTAVLVKLLCTRQPTRRRPQPTSTPGACPEHHRGFVQDVSFSAGTGGELTQYRFLYNHREPPGVIRYQGVDGRYRACGYGSDLMELASPKPFEGAIGTDASSEGINYTIGINQVMGDAIDQLPSNDVTCTFEEADPANPTNWINPRPITFPPGPPTPSRLHDNTRAAYEVGTEWSGGELDLSVGRRFGSTITKTWRFQDFKYAYALGGPPSLLGDRITLTLRPCPRGGRDVEGC